MTEGTPPADYLSRSEALRILCVKPQTLYSYVSRGLVRRIRTPDGRTSQYNYHDLQRLKARSVARSGHGAVAASAIHWGEPILDTGITEITAAGPRYRTRLATDLAREQCSFESVAEFLWRGAAPSKGLIWKEASGHDELADQLDRIVRAYPDIHIRQLMTELVLLQGIACHRAGQLPEFGNDDIEAARDLVHSLAGVFGFLGPSKAYVAARAGEQVAETLARALGVSPDSKHAGALNSALILVADHELTPATFAARIAASVHSDLHSCIGAALPVHFGSMLGLRCDWVEQAIAADTKESVDFLLQDSDRSVGFHHPLYVNGDPRAMMMLELALDIERGKPPRPPRTLDLRMLRPELTTMDEALVALCRTLGIARQTAGGLLALGRAAGWIAHVIEQRRDDFVIRPRGKFVPDQPV